MYYNVYNFMYETKEDPQQLYWRRQFIMVFLLVIRD